MDFCWITLDVNDMNESLDFYHELLGIKILERFSVGEELEIAMLGEEDKPKIELICNKRKPIAHSANVSVGFKVESLKGAMDYLTEKNIQIKRGPISPIPTSSFFFVDDPNGIEIQIVEIKEI